MKNKMDFNKAKCDELAKDLFFKNAGLNKEGGKFERMRVDGLKVLDELQGSINIDGIYKSFPKPQALGDELVLDKVTLKCKAFEQIDPGSIEQVMVYAVTAGDFTVNEDDVSKQVYADLWGTAYVDAARLLMKEKLEEMVVLSDSFGPGFYGMDVGEIYKMDKLLVLSSIGIKINTSGVLTPNKSGVGIYFSVNEKYKKIKTQCRDCLGNESSCKLCNI